MRLIRLIAAVTLLAALASGLAACSPAPPNETPSISGAITTVTPGEGNLGSVLVEGTGAYDKASVSVTPATSLLRATANGYERAMFADLTPGTRVDVWFTGAVAESYPVQATARVLVIAR